MEDSGQKHRARQLRLWVAGYSVHNPVDDECCPDFSCCKRELLAPLPMREKFFRAILERNDDVQGALLMYFLQAGMSSHLAQEGQPAVSVYIAGEDHEGAGHG